MDITRKCYTNNTTIKKDRKIEYIVIHYTAGISSESGRALSTAKYFGSNYGASADFIVDDANVVQYNPDIENRYTWHSGGRALGTKGGTLCGIAKNENSISIEICSTNSTGKMLAANDESWSFSDKVLSNAILLTKTLMKDYNIPVERVIRHYDVTGKFCPGVIGWNEDDNSKWEEFKAALVEDEHQAADEHLLAIRDQLISTLLSFVDQLKSIK